MTSTTLSPLDPVAFFSRTWEGGGELRLARALRRLPGPKRFRFRSFTTMVREDFWIVHDELRWEDGHVELHDGLCRRVDQTRLRMTYDGMLGGTEVSLRADGYQLAPYTMLVAAGGLPFRLPVRCRDECRLVAPTTLLDTIELSFLGMYLGRLAMRLEAAPASP